MNACGPSGERPERSDVNLHRQDSTRYYMYDIKLPEIVRSNATLRDTLTALADAQQAEFLSRADRDTMPESATYPWELQLQITVSDSTDRFISLLGVGYEYMGGAHGMPFHITLNYDQRQDRFITLPELLGDSTALEPISEYVRRDLAQQFMEARQQPVQGNSSVEQFIRENKWLREGTAPGYANYRNVLLQPAGLRFIFSAYQVAPYASGTPDVEVPVSVFRDELSPEARQLFQTD